VITATRRVLLLCGLAVAGWAVVRVVLLLTGSDVADDPHGYATVFSLVLTPVLGLAVWALVSETAALWRGHHHRRFASGVALALSAPLAGSHAVAGVVLGVAIVGAARLDVRR
jgi:hypothetical protein